MERFGSCGSGENQLPSRRTEGQSVAYDLPPPRFTLVLDLVSRDLLIERNKMSKRGGKAKERNSHLVNSLLASFFTRAEKSVCGLY